MSVGVVASITQLVVKVIFDDDVPTENEVLIVENEASSMLLVDHIEPVGVAYCLNINSDKTIQKKDECN